MNSSKAVRKYSSAAVHVALERNGIRNFAKGVFGSKNSRPRLATPHLPWSPQKGISRIGKKILRLDREKAWRLRLDISEKVLRAREASRQDTAIEELPEFAFH